MSSQFLNYAGLTLVIMGLTGVISETGPLWSRYILFAVGFILLLVSYFKRRKN